MGEHHSLKEPLAAFPGGDLIAQGIADSLDRAVLTIA